MKKAKILLFSILASVMMLSSSITVFAAAKTQGGNDVQEYIDKYGTNKISEYLHLDYDGEDAEVTVNGVKQYLDTAAYSVIDAHIESENKKGDAQNDTINQLRDINDGLNIQPDIEGAMGSISGFVPAINFVLGFLVSIISAGMTILTACDICYIVFPVIRGKCENMKQNGTATSKSRSEKAGETRLAFISDEAEYSINAAETTQTGKNPLIIYFKKRAVALIVLAVVIFVLLTGNINLITNIAIKAVSGILKIIQDMAA